MEVLQGPIGWVKTVLLGQYVFNTDDSPLRFENIPFEYIFFCKVRSASVGAAFRDLIVFV